MAVGYPVDLGAPAARLCDRLGDCMLGFHLEPYASSCLRSPPLRGTLYGMLGTDAQSTDAAGRLSSERAADPHHSGLRWLQAFTMTTGQRLQPINTAVIARVLATLGVRTWTIGVDGVVVSTGRRSSGPSAGSIRITGRCRVTTRSGRTWSLRICRSGKVRARLESSCTVPPMRRRREYLHRDDSRTV